MATRERGVLKSKANDDAPVLFLSLDSNALQSRKSKISKASFFESERTTNAGKPKTFVNLYMRVLGAKHIPEREGSVQLEVKQVKDTVRKLECHYTEETTFDLKSLGVYLPTFSITIGQDNLEDMNIFSDNPLLITLFESSFEETEEEDHDHHHDEKEEEQSIQSNESKDKKVKEVIKPIGQALIDLMQFFSKRRSNKTFDIFLYPNKPTSASESTCKISLEFYTLLPLIKEIGFTNIIFLTLESIYNLNECLMSNHDELQLKLLIRSYMPRASKPETMDDEICSYSKFARSIINQQDGNIVWETAKHTGEGIINGLGIQTGNRISMHRLFRFLFCTENVDFKFDEINSHIDEALICNSWHRFIMYDKLASLLSDSIGHDEKQLIVQLIFGDQDIVLEGTVDLSVFLYPMVNAMRYAVELRPVVTKKRRSIRSTLTSTRRCSEYQTNGWLGQHPDRPVFATIGICLLTPVTEDAVQSKTYTYQQMRSCEQRELEVAFSSAGKKIIIGEAYTEFDETMIGLVRNIIDCEFFDTTTDEAQRFLCSNRDEVRDRVLNLIAIDFNQRIKTKDNIEFTRLLTIVYKELVERNHARLSNADLKKSRKIQPQLISRFTTTKYLKEAGNSELSNLILNTLRQDYPQSNDLDFYLFLYDVERQEFDRAKEFLKSGNVKGDFIYFVNLIEVYIKHIDDIANEESPNEALEKLVIHLKDHMKYYPIQYDGWLLLYALYKQQGYAPGVSVARWRYESIANVSQVQLPTMPKSRWDIYLSYELPIKEKRSKLFHHAFNTYVQLGMYRFAECVFSEFSGDLSKQECEFVETTLKILINQSDLRHTKLALFKPVDMDAKKIVQVQVNGNLEYFCGNFEVASLFYGAIVAVSENVEDISFEGLQLSLLRFAYMSTADGEYEQAVRAFERLCLPTGSCIHIAYGMGLANYKLGNWKRAEYYFSECTEYKLFLPDIWGYLAIVNLKMGNNGNALECWKQAHINPEQTVSAEVKEELAKIDVDSINLYVERL